MKIPFVKPPFTGEEESFIIESLRGNSHAGLGPFTAKVNEFLESKFSIGKSFLTTSCTDALEMSSFLIEGEPGDEFIVPSYTFSSTANAYASRGMTPVFCEITKDTLNLDPNRLEELITEKTKAIVPIHYGGVPADMDEINEIAKRHNIPVIEDAAQAVNSKYKGRYAGSLADMSTFSFHVTKSYSCGEGGALGINNKEFLKRAEFVLEKGTDRSLVIQGLKNKYSWVDYGSSFVLSDILASLLHSQLLNIDSLQAIRQQVYYNYTSLLSEVDIEGLTYITSPDYCNINYHAFWVLFPTNEMRDLFISESLKRNISPYIGYMALHKSKMGRKIGSTPYSLDWTEQVENRIVRLPFYLMNQSEMNYIRENLKDVFESLKQFQL